MKSKNRCKKNKSSPEKKTPVNGDSEMERKILLQLNENREITKALNTLLERFSAINKKEPNK